MPSTDSSPTPLSPEERARLEAFVRKAERALEDRANRNRLASYAPYPKQLAFHAAGKLFRERLFRAGNQLGKTTAGGAEAAFHATGLYPEPGQFRYPDALDDGRPHPLAGRDIWPDGWQGRRLERPANGWVGGPSGELVRDGAQRVLCGRTGAIGTGLIPGDLIVHTQAARGTPDLFDYVTVRHKAGGLSTIKFKSYEQGRVKWQSETLDWIWYDEEPPLDIYTEGLTRTNATGGFIWLTFTPLLGMTQTVGRFLVEQSPDRHDTNMTIVDALHIDPEERDRIIASYPEHEREARINGAPMLGSGRIYPIPESMLRVPPFKIPRHWPSVAALDFGWEHPTAAVQLAWDREADVVYVVRCHRQKTETPLVHSATLKGWGTWLPWAWPQDGLAHGRDGTTPLARQYRGHGLGLLPDPITWDDGTNSVEPGLMDLLERMQTGRLKVVDGPTTGDWLEEFRLYHRRDGKIVKLNDDLMDATRYGIMGLRFAVTPPGPRNLADRTRYYG